MTDIDLLIKELDAGCNDGQDLPGLLNRAARALEAQQADRAAAISTGFFRSESAMWLNAGSNHEWMRVQHFREHYSAYRDAGGKVWGE